MPVTDPDLIQRLNAQAAANQAAPQTVTDPDLIQRLNAQAGAQAPVQATPEGDPDESTFEYLMRQDRALADYLGVGDAIDQISGGARAFGHDLLLGGGDEIVGGIGGAYEGAKNIIGLGEEGESAGEAFWRGYDESADPYNQQLEEFAEEYPTTASLAGGAGELASYVAPGLGGLRLAKGAARIPAMMATSGASGAARGALAEEGLENRLEGAAIQGGLDAVLAPVAGPIGRGIAGGAARVIDNVPGARQGLEYLGNRLGSTADQVGVFFNNFLTRNRGDVDAIRAANDAAYGALRTDPNVIDPAFYDSILDRMARHIDDYGMDPLRSPHLNRMMDTLGTRRGTQMNVGEYDQLRRLIGDQLNNRDLIPEEARVIRKLMGVYDEGFDQLTDADILGVATGNQLRGAAPGTAADIVRDVGMARENARRLAVYDNISKLVDSAELRDARAAHGHFDDRLRAVAANILESPEMAARMTPQEAAMLRNFAEMGGSGGQNTARALSRYDPTSGSLRGIAAGLGGITAGIGGIGTPIGAITGGTLATLGSLARPINRTTARQNVNRMLDAVLTQDFNRVNRDRLDPFFAPGVSDQVGEVMRELFVRDDF